MNKLLKTILTVSITLIGVTIFAVPETFAQPPDLVVQFEQTPLFNETNFLPGDSIAHWAKVTNNTSQTKKIITEAINEIDPYNLGSQLDLVIKEDTATRYSGTLSDFFTTSEVYLSDLTGGGSQTQYLFTITFNPLAGNDYQSKNLGFDLVLGFFSSTGPIIGPPNPVMIGGGGGGIETLRIYNEKSGSIAETSATITWDTNMQSTSRVIYSPCSQAHTFNPSGKPNYGYPYSTAEDSSLVYSHSSNLTGLLQATSYCYRVISHTGGSSDETVSGEFSFVTLGVAGITEELPPTFPGSNGSSESSTSLNGGTSGGNNGTTSSEEGTSTGEVEGATAENAFLAAINDFFNLKNLWWLFLILLVIFLALYFLYTLLRRKRGENKK